MAELEGSKPCFVHEATNNNDVSLVIPAEDVVSCVLSRSEQVAVSLPPIEGSVRTNSCQSCAMLEPAHKHHNDSLKNEQLCSDSATTLDDEDVPKLLSKCSVGEGKVEPKEAEVLNDDD